MKHLLLSAAVISIVFASPVLAQTPEPVAGITQALSQARDNDERCAQLTADYANRNPEKVAEIASIGTITCGGGATSLIANKMAQNFPGLVNVIAAAMVAANPAAVAEIVLAMATVFPEEEQEAVLDELIASVKNIPGVSTEDVGSIGLPFPGVESPGAGSLPQGGKIAFDVISPV